MMSQRNRVRPLQFRLATMFLAVTAFCLLLTTFQALSLLSISAGTILALAIFAHIAGNAIGVRLRTEGDREKSETSLPSTDFHSTRQKLQPQDFAPDSLLRRHVAIGRPMVVTTTIGAMLGAVVGGIALASVNQDHLRLTSLLVGASAFSVIGALAGFLGGSFIGVFSSAVFQAQRDVPPQQKN